MKVLVTGAAGHLGTAVVDRFKTRHDVVGLSRAELDLRDASAVAETVRRLHPEGIINCAAFNAVDDAEDEPVLAFEVNAFGVLGLARAAADAGAALVQYSTDFVFDGRTTSPYLESDRPNPLSVYGASKLLGEWFARENARAYVLRVESLFGGAGGRGTLEQMVSAILNDDEIRAFVDRVVSPSRVDDVARATEALLERGASPDIYHCVNSGQATWEEVAREVGRLLGRQPRLTPVRMTDVSLRARRPLYCALSNRRLAELGIEMPTWQDALAEYLATRTMAARQPSVRREPRDGPSDREA